MNRSLLLLLCSLPLFGATAPATGTLSPQAASRFLDQATWGPTPASVAELQQQGIQAWLNAQFSAPTSDLPDQPELGSDGKTNEDLGPVQSAFFVNAISGKDQLRQRVTFVLSQLLVVSHATMKPAYAFPPYWRVLRDNAFGSYRDILKAITLSPAMGTYLSMANNNKGNPAKGTSANENYARELMQLFSLGLDQLNPDGSLVTDGSGNPVPTYTQAEVTSLAKALTGWTYPTAPKATAKTNNPPYYIGTMFAVEAEHDTTSKTIFNNLTIPAGQSAEKDLDTLLDDIMAQPTIAPFISKQLIQHLVTSNPSPAYVQRVSSVFTTTKGDMKSVITAILTDTEARAGDDPAATVNPNFGHLREPLLFLTSMVRALGGTVTATNSLNGASSELGESVFEPPTVFSYFTPQYKLESGLYGPEFQIYSTQTASDRADVVNSAIYGKLDGGVTLDLTPFTNAASDITKLMNLISATFLHSNMSAALTNAASIAAEAATTPAEKAQAALYIVLTSSEYQVIR